DRVQNQHQCDAPGPTLKNRLALSNPFGLRRRETNGWRSVGGRSCPAWAGGLRPDRWKEGKPAMMTEPEIFQRPAQNYIYVTFTVPMTDMQRPANEGFPQIFAHVGTHGLTPIGPAFYNFRRINMAETLDVEAGVAVD